MKEITLSLHSSTLVDYIKNKRIPRGLRTSLAPNLLTDDHVFIRKWYGLCNQFSLDLMFLTVQHLQDRITSVREEANTVESELLGSISADKLTEVLESIQNSTAKLKENILKTKKRKLERDARDYELNQVYTWSKKKRSVPRHQNVKPAPTEPSTSADRAASSSDSGESSNTDSRRRRSFLGRRQGGQRKKEPPPSWQDTPRPQTRSRSGRGKARGQQKW